MPQYEGGAKAGKERFVQLLNKKGLVTLLDQFLTYETLPQTQKSLGEMTDLDQGTISRRVNELADLGIVEEIESTSPKEYQLNMKHPATPKLVAVHTDLQDHVRDIHRQSDDFHPEEAGPHDGSPFVELFRYPTNVEILATFMEYEDTQLSVSHLADLADLDYTTVAQNVELLHRVDIIKSLDHPVEPKDTMYTLNADHPAKDGFESVIFALQPEEPITPSDKDDVSVMNSADRVENIRDHISSLLEVSLDTDDRWDVGEQIPQDIEKSLEAYALQQRASEVTEKSEASNDEASKLTCESKNDVTYCGDSHSHCGREGFSGKSHRGHKRTNMTAA